MSRGGSPGRVPRDDDLVGALPSLRRRRGRVVLLRLVGAYRHAHVRCFRRARGRGRGPVPRGHELLLPRHRVRRRVSARHHRARERLVLAPRVGGAGVRHVHALGQIILPWIFTPTADEAEANAHERDQEQRKKRELKEARRERGAEAGTRRPRKRVDAANDDGMVTHVDIERPLSFTRAKTMLRPSRTPLFNPSVPDFPSPLPPRRSLM